MGSVSDPKMECLTGKCMLRCILVQLLTVVMPAAARHVKMFLMCDCEHCRSTSLCVVACCSHCVSSSSSAASFVSYSGRLDTTAWVNSAFLVVDVGTNRKRVYDFLLVINSNLCRISHRFGDTASYWSKIANSYPPTLIQRPRLGWPPSNFGMNLISPETRMMGLPYGEEIMIVGRTMWSQSTSVTDGRTDRQTDRQTELR